MKSNFSMNKLARYIIISVVTAAVLAVAWYFSNIVAYVLIAAVLSLIGKPLKDAISKVRIKNIHLPCALCAAITLAALWLVFVLFFYFFIPLILEQVGEFSKVNVAGVTEQLDAPLQKVDEWVQKYFAADFSLQATLHHEVQNVVNVAQLSGFVGSLAGLIKSFGIALFAISFITFFFLKEDKLFFQAITLLFPQRYEQNITRALSSVNRLLVRYFTGMFADIICVMTLITLGLTFVAGFSLKQALFLGLLAGVFNVVPYVGPLMGYALGTLLCVVTSVSTGVPFLPLELKLLLVFFAVQVIDMAFLQPAIYSNSVKAHPLEIFLVILLAGSLAGVLGMLIAIPTYTVLRVFAKEFFNNFRVVQKLTEKI
ncbi:MAG: AI-2E family transporter [Prevotellaceae bacterium]|jgi:predicted PurR-regulated permease PerM|nr:AI-2E family transporter [Prevotellaceae bacterium]